MKRVLVKVQSEMRSLRLHSSANKSEALDLAVEVARLENLLFERRGELVALQEEFQWFKARYTQTVGSRLSELAEIERAIKAAETQRLGVEANAGREEPDDEETHAAAQAVLKSPISKSVRKLFWAVAKMFHPDRAADAQEARHRHTIMAEASRAYREGDVESLRTLLGDEELHFFCTGANIEDDPQDLASRLFALKEELRTVEFGIKRLKLNGLYQLKLGIDKEAQGGRDALAEQAERIDRQIVKARRRLAHLS